MTEPTKYESYIDTGNEWLGAIPSSWNTILLSQAVYQVKNKNLELQEKNLLSLSYGKIKRKPIDANGGLLPESFDGYNIIETNDIVLRLTDLQNDHRSLRVGISPERGIITSAYITLRPRKQSAAKYLYYLLHTFDIRKGFYGMGSGVRQGLNYDEVKRLKLPLPTEPEQKAISDYLDNELSRVDAIISESKACIEEYKLWKTSIIYEAVTNGLDPNVEMKDSGIEWIGEMPKHWRKVKLKQSSEITSGQYISKEEYAINGQYDIIGANGKIGTLNQANNSKQVLTTGRVGTIGTVRKTCKAWITDNALIVDVKNHLSLDYAYYVIPNFDFKAMTAGTAMPLTTATKLGNQVMPYPPADEQKSISAYLDEKCMKVEGLIDETLELINELESYKKSLIFEVVTGKRRVC